jgi:hypothetical protein
MSLDGRKRINGNILWEKGIIYLLNSYCWSLSAKTTVTYFDMSRTLIQRRRRSTKCKLLPRINTRSAAHAKLKLNRLPSPRSTRSKQIQPFDGNCFKSFDRIYPKHLSVIATKPSNTLFLLYLHNLLPLAQLVRNSAGAM